MERDNELETMDETGSAVPPSKVVTVDFGPYAVTIRLTPTDEFVEVVAVRIAKDFRSIRERNKGVGFHDVSDLY
jgi:hypothetical protein